MVVSYDIDVDETVRDREAVRLKTLPELVIIEDGGVVSLPTLISEIGSNDDIVEYYETTVKPSFPRLSPKRFGLWLLNYGDYPTPETGVESVKPLSPL